VVVLLDEACLVGVRVGVGLLVVAVLVLVLDVVMIVQNMGMLMRYIPVGVLMAVLRGHRHCSLSDRFLSGEIHDHIGIF
jgi:hypothetical protein